MFNYEKSKRKTPKMQIIETIIPMKKLLLIKIGLLIFLSFNQKLIAQSISYLINFEDTTSPYDLRIDTISNSNNIWEIGEPNKVLFDSAYSKPNAIVTDLQNPYPINDTSSFIIYHLAQGGLAQDPYPATILEFYYKVDTDSLNDFGLVEFSPDNGTTWVNLLDSSSQNINYQGPPTITGRSNEWQFISLEFADLGAYYNIQHLDSVQIRFTFISDNVSNGKEGLMFDNIFFYDSGFIGVDSYDKNCIFFKTYPNPCQKELHIEYENKEYDTHSLYVFNTQGKIIKTIDKDKNNNLIILNTNSYNAGIYYFLLINNHNKKQSKGAKY